MLRVLLSIVVAVCSAVVFGGELLRREAILFLDSRRDLAAEYQREARCDMFKGRSAARRNSDGRTIIWRCGWIEGSMVWKR